MRKFIWHVRCPAPSFQIVAAHLNNQHHRSHTHNVRENWNFYLCTSSWSKCLKLTQKKYKIIEKWKNVECEHLLRRLKCHEVCSIEFAATKIHDINNAKQTWLGLAVALVVLISANPNFWIFNSWRRHTHTHACTTTTTETVFISLTFKKGTNACHFIYVCLIRNLSRIDKVSIWKFIYIVFGGEIVHWRFSFFAPKFRVFV